MDTAHLKDAFLRWSTAMQQAAPELNALDGELGDGDLGVTLSQCAQNVRAALPQAPDTMTGILRAASQACADASGSSFGTLLASGLLGALGLVDVECRRLLGRTHLLAVGVHLALGAELVAAVT